MSLQILVIRASRPVVRVFDNRGSSIVIQQLWSMQKPSETEHKEQPHGTFEHFTNKESLTTS